MLNRSILKRHAALMDRMATAVGVDLEESVMRGDLRPSELSDGVLRCGGCSNPDHCESWLDKRTGQATDTPGYCRNGDLFRMLKPHTS